VIRRIRELMAVPFARPPGRRSALARFAPEICAGAVWLVFLLVCLLADSSSRFPGRFGPADSSPALVLISKASAAAYGLSWLLLIFLPIRAGAAAWAGERDREAMEALVLTPLDHRRLALGRFWHVLTPWLRLVLYLVPLYMLMANGSVLRELLAHLQRDAPEWIVLMAYAPRPYFASTQWATASFSFWPAGGGEAPLLLWRVLLMGLRLLDDLSVFVFAVGAGFYISTRLKTTRRALLVSQLVVLGGMLTVMVPDLWLVAILGMVAGVTGSDGRTLMLLFGAAATAAMAGRYLAGCLAIRAAVRNFDAYAVGEKPDK
jgi:hypothetical protein